MPETFYGRVREQYQKNRQLWPNEEDMPSPKTFQSACDWIDGNAGADDFFLMVEAFDPHEPFDVPDKYMEMYGGTGGLDRDYFEIPEYKRVSATDVNPEAEDYLQRRYKALVTMTDHWFGKLIDKLAERGMLEDTMVMVTTDHGYFLGERDYMGKNYMHLYNELAHLPFIVHFPGNARAGEHAHQLTQAIDIMPTVLDAHGCEIPADVRGASLVPLMTDPDAPTRDYALYGVHAMTVNVTDGRYTYFRAPVPGTSRASSTPRCRTPSARRWVRIVRRRSSAVAISSAPTVQDSLQEAGSDRGRRAPCRGFRDHAVRSRKRLRPGQQPRRQGRCGGAAYDRPAAARPGGA